MAVPPAGNKKKIGIREGVTETGYGDRPNEEGRSGLRKSSLHISGTKFLLRNEELCY